jgi:aryl-alcohol dehydrogenase-like predicted oxidoreductase
MPFANFKLKDGYMMPAIAFGSGSVNKGHDIHEYVENALEHGFSHIDTAQCRCLTVVPSISHWVPQSMATRRASVWLFEKAGSLVPTSSSPPNGRIVVQMSANPLKRVYQRQIRKFMLGSYSHVEIQLGLEYVDLFLVHVPQSVENNVEHVWRQFEEVREIGLTR